MPTIPRSIFPWHRRPQSWPTLWKRCSSSCLHEPEAISIAEIIEEETLAGDRLKYFHPTRPGEVLDGRFKTITKLGYGSSSTVWLAENLKFSKWKNSSVPRYVSVKIVSLDTHALREPTNAKIIAHANPQHEGLSFIHLPGDEFQLPGPQGTHSCLVYEPMRETLYQFQRRAPDEKLPLPLFKLYMYCLLEAVDYLHTECHLIHTDIKDDNVMVTFEDEAVLDDFVKVQRQIPQTQHIRPEDGHVTFLSQGDFGPLRGTRILPRLADFNLCFPGLDGRAHISAIQSHCYRAPEVLLGCPWTYSVDIWNLGLLMWNLLEDVSLFDRPAGDDGEYDAHVHLAQMVRLLGEPPEAVIQRERRFREHKLQKPVVNFKGIQCHSMNEFWGGPFFDDDDHISRRDLLERGGNLRSTVTQIEGDDKEQFLDLAGSMLEWIPEKRGTAKELLRHQFFDSLMRDRERDG